MASTATVSSSDATATTRISSTSTVANTISITSPLSTAFTPDSSCVAPTFTLSPLGSDSFEDGELVRGLYPTCFPYGFIPSIVNNDAPPVPTLTDGSGSNPITQIVFSGAPCPGLYSVAASTGTLYSNQSFNLLTCCPSPMSLSVQSGSSLACVARNINATIKEYTGAFLTLSQSIPTYTTEVALMRAPAVVALSPTTVSTTSSSTTSLSSTSTLAPSSSQTPSTLPSSQPQGGGLSTGAKAGIGVGVGVGGLLLIVTIIFVAIFLRRRRKPDPAPQAKDEASAFDKAELSGEGRTFPELSGQAQLLEADRNERPLEMDSSNTRAELEGDPVAERPG